MVSTITTSLDKTIASLDLEQCVCIIQQVRYELFQAKGTHARQKNREKIGETDRGVIASSSISR